MKTDKYMKFILTLIALCLVWICARDVFPQQIVQASSSAAAPAQEVVITGVKIPLRDAAGAPLTDINGKPLFAWELPVSEGGR